MIKYDLIYEQLNYEGTIFENQFFEPEPIDESLVLKVHHPDYWLRLKNRLLTKSEIRKTGFPHSNELVQRELVIMNGTVQAAFYALKYGVAVNISGGTHHAFSTHGEGFCLLNDVVIGSEVLMKEYPSIRILIIDLDVHQGNGTAEMLKQNPQVFTFSMHGKNNYPLLKQTSDLDVPLDDEMKDDQYLILMERHINAIINQFKPDFAFYNAGADVLKDDVLGKLSLTLEGAKIRDEFVIQKCKDLNIPICIVMGGGYNKHLYQLTEAHCNTIRIANELLY